MLAVNDNLTWAQCKAGVEPAPSMPEFGPEARIVGVMRDWPEKGVWMMFKRYFAHFGPLVRPVIEPVAMQPHPGCPPWDGVTPRMSGVSTAPRPQKAPSPALRLV